MMGSDYEGLYAVKCHLGSDLISRLARLEPTTLWSEVGSTSQVNAPEHVFKFWKWDGSNHDWHWSDLFIQSALHISKSKFIQNW